jgi:hypothetical protein
MVRLSSSRTGGDLGGGAAEEDLVGDVELVAGQGALHERQAEVFADDVSDRVAG